MDRTTQLIASRARRVVRKRKRAQGAKISSSRETAVSVNAIPPKLKKSTPDEVDIRIEVEKSSTSIPLLEKANNSQVEQIPAYLSRFWEGRESRSLEDVQRTHSTARKLVDLQLDNDRLRRDVRDLEKKHKDVNRQLKQEREHYEEQRWSYVQEIRATIKDTHTVTTQTKEYLESNDDEDDTLANELRKMREMFYKQRNISCRLSEKFLTIRDDRNRLNEQLKRLELVYSTVIDELLKHIAEVRVYFASIKKGVLLERSAVASLVDRNAKLGYNNAILQLEILKYQKKLEALKSQSVDCTDGYEVEKFLARCRSSQLLAVCGGGDDSKGSHSVHVTQRGSFINVPVAVVNGNRVETKLAPLFSVVRLCEKKDENRYRRKWQREKQRREVKAKMLLAGRRTKSVPSKVWRIKYEMKPSKSRHALKSEPDRLKVQDPNIEESFDQRSSACSSSSDSSVEIDE